jgi:hypothetical protein
MRARHLHAPGCAFGAWSSRTMARTGLRMMPTFPSSSLKFRTAGFPRYGFKASMSDGTFLNNHSVKPAPGLPSQSPSLSPSFARFPTGREFQAQSPDLPGVRRAAVQRHYRPFTPGVLGSGSSSVVSIHPRLLRPHPPVPQAHCDFTTRSLIRSAFAVRERLGDPRDFPYFCCRPCNACRRPYPGGPPNPPVVHARRFQASSNL